MYKIVLIAYCIALLFVSCSKNPVHSDNSDRKNNNDFLEPLEFIIIRNKTERKYLPGFGVNGDDRRPVTSITDPKGHSVEFVADELVLTTDNTDSLNDFIARYKGSILMEVNPDEYGIPDVPAMYLIRIGTRKADTESLSDNIKNICQSEGFDAGGTYRFEDETGAALMSIAAAEKLCGYAISVNWITVDDAIPDSALESPNIFHPQNHNCYTWSWWNRDSSFGAGVPEAWSLLYHAGKIDNRVKIAVLDGGFWTKGDYPVEKGISVLPGREPFDTKKPFTDKNWHGTKVSSSIFALPDDMYGSAGVAGPVAIPLHISTTSDFFFPSSPSLRRTRKVHVSST